MTIEFLDSADINNSQFCWKERYKPESISHFRLYYQYRRTIVSSSMGVSSPVVFLEGSYQP